MTVRYFENVGVDFIDPGVFEGRNGFVEGGNEFDSSVVIERMVNQGCKAIRWTSDNGSLKTVGYAIMLNDDQIVFNCLASGVATDEFDDMVASIKVQKEPESAVNSDEWTQTQTIKSATEIQKEEEAAKKAAEEETRKAREKATHSAGSYKVGSDIPAGEYKLTASGSGYYCVYPDTGKSKILENDNFTSVNYITVEDGQYIELSRCTMVEIAYASPTTTPSGDGMYKVGFDIPAGEYKLNSGSKSGYYCIHDNSTVNRRIVQNDNFDGSTYCVVSDGQYLVLSRATIE